jgi:hypothetical protein
MVRVTHDACNITVHGVWAQRELDSRSRVASNLGKGPGSEGKGVVMTLASQARKVASHHGEADIECNCGTRYITEEPSASWRLFVSHLMGQHEDGFALVQCLAGDVRKEATVS